MEIQELINKKEAELRKFALKDEELTTKLKLLERYKALGMTNTQGISNRPHITPSELLAWHYIFVQVEGIDELKAYNAVKSMHDKTGEKYCPLIDKLCKGVTCMAWKDKNCTHFNKGAV